MKIFTSAAIAILMSSGMAFAQDNSTTGGDVGQTSGSDSDSNPNYLTGPNIQRFYTDDSMTTLRPEAEFKSAWEGLSEQDRASAKQACSGNKDNRWSTFCNSIGSM